MKRQSLYANDAASGGQDYSCVRVCSGNASPSNDQTRLHSTIPTRFHQRRPLLHDSDALLAREWNQLTLRMREQVQEEVHGVASSIQEEDEFVNKWLIELDVELRNIRKRSAYDKAVFLNPSYVKNRDFGLMFLRSEYFDAQKAANRLVDHFEMKLELFGVEKLATDITLEDLREDALDCLNCGTIQVLPKKDRSGRTVICALQAYQKYDTYSIPDVS
jgi:hypothetical protein